MYPIYFQIGRSEGGVAAYFETINTGRAVIDLAVSLFGRILWG